MGDLMMVGRVVASEEKGWHLREEPYAYAFMDSDPERDDFTVEVLKGDPDVFRSFLSADMGICPIGKGGRLQKYADLGSSRDLSVGTLITVTFEEYFDTWLETQVSHANQVIYILCKDAMADWR